jgi:hypothetical protein
MIPPIESFSAHFKYGRWECHISQLSPVASRFRPAADSRSRVTKSFFQSSTSLGVYYSGLPEEADNWSGLALIPHFKTFHRSLFVSCGDSLKNVSRIYCYQLNSGRVFCIGSAGTTVVSPDSLFYVPR